jgi:hypothetical protein
MFEGKKYPSGKNKKKNFSTFLVQSKKHLIFTQFFQSNHFLLPNSFKSILTKYKKNYRLNLYT